MSEAPLIIVPALFLGGIIGIIELFFVHADERGMGWLGHGLHALPATMFFTFISMNVSYALSLVGQSVSVNWQIELAVRVVIAIIAMLKISAAAAIVGRVGEKFGHSHDRIHNICSAIFLAVHRASTHQAASISWV